MTLTYLITISCMWVVSLRETKGDFDDFLFCFVLCIFSSTSMICFVHLVRRRYGSFIAFMVVHNEQGKKPLPVFCTMCKKIPFRKLIIYIFKFRSPIKNQNAATSSYKREVHDE